MSCLLWTAGVVRDEGNSCLCLGSWCRDVRGGAVWVTAKQVLWLKQKLWCHIILTEHIFLTVSDPLDRSIKNHCLNGSSVHHSCSRPLSGRNQIPAFRLKLVRLIYIVIIEFFVIVHVKRSLYHSLCKVGGWCRFTPVESCVSQQNGTSFCL